jgi:hypothetical protein
VHLDTQELLRRRRHGHLQQGLAHAEADFQYALPRTAEGPVEIQERAVEVETPARPAVLEAAALGLGHAPGAQHEAADTAPRRRSLAQSSFHPAAARQAQPAMKARPPSGVTAPSQRMPVILST